MKTDTNAVADKVYVEVTDDSFATEVLNSDQPVLVDFWASWCGPCRMISPVVESLALDFAGKAKVAKVDVDANPQLCAQFNIRSIPALLFFKNGKLMDGIVGAASKTVIADKLSKCL
ncbi:MAG: thioredoxin [Pedosphaera sp.]|nr:thioredoxin [Pedosphaera sp.]